jgi:hypothetical protein
MFSAKQIRSRFFPAGNMAAPSLAFQADKTLGFYRHAAGVIGVAVAGNNSLRFAAGGVVYGSSANFLELSATGYVILAASGANQDLTLSASGTGALVKNAATHRFRNQSGGTEYAQFNSSGNFLVGTTTDSGNGRIQLATHTTSAGGIGFGTDVTLYRSGADALKTDDTFSAAYLESIGWIKSSNATLGIGYATGAGGTVTQVTSKSTGVTLNKVCGFITMHAAALAAGTIVSFNLTNSAIASSDVLVLMHTAGGTIGAYTLQAAAGAGSATIYVRNNTAGSLSEAIVIGYALIKAVSA